MSQINITQNKNTVTVNGETRVVTVKTAGPQGPSGPAGSGFDLDSTNKVNGSIIYYDSSSAKFKADQTTTKSTIVDGGSF
tara:strand:+ start:1468 stop:1707 length:240 start_codon:yes stop_codon:yes gene_type:complete